MRNKRIQYSIMAIGFLLIVVACKTAKPEPAQPAIATEVETAQQQLIDTGQVHPRLASFPEIATETNRQVLIDKMIAGGRVNESAVGFAGAYTETYACYERLQQLLSDKDWVALTGHASPIIRSYALKALQAGNETLFKEVRVSLLQDTATVQYFSGCMLNRVPVNYFAH